MAYWTTGSFVPFDDTLKPPQKIYQRTDNPNYDTSVFDFYRQGIEIRNTKHLYMSTQPKFVNGKIDFYTNTVSQESNELTTYGQAVSFSDFYGNHTFEEKPTFDPVRYIVLGNSYPFPIIFNDGPQQQQEAIMEPFTIPYRLSPTTEGPQYAHRIYGSLQDGNDFDDPYLKGCSRIENYVEFAQPLTTRPFLDEGEQIIARTDEGTVKKDGYLSNVQKVIQPFKDRTIQELVLESSNATSSLLGILDALKFDRNDNTQPSGKKMIFGTNYGPNVAQYGIESICYSNRLRGS